MIRIQSFQRLLRMLALGILLASPLRGDELPAGPAPAVPPDGLEPGTYPNFTVTAANWVVDADRNHDQEPDWSSNDILMNLAGEGPLPWSLTGFSNGRLAPRLNVADPEGAAAIYGVSPFDTTFSGSGYEWEADRREWAPNGAAWSPHPAKGILLASVRKNSQQWNDDQSEFQGIVALKVDGSRSEGYNLLDGSFGDGQIEVLIDRAGNANQGIIDTSVAWFPYDQGWLGGYVASPDEEQAGRWFQPEYHHPELPAAAAPIVQWSITSDIVVSPAIVRLPNVNAQTDGMLFTHSIEPRLSSVARITAADPLPDGSGWEVMIRPDTELDHTFAEELGLSFCFLYVPYASEHLIGGHVRGSDANVLNGRGHFTVERLGVGRYSLSIPDKSPTAGMILLGAAGRLARRSDIVGRNFLSYQPVEQNKFVVESRYHDEGDEHPLEDTDFYFAWIDFAQPLAPPGFSLSLEPPAITRQPSPQSIPLGGEATFRVEVTGDEPLVYQWLRDNEPIEGADQATFTLADATLADIGIYQVQVSNGGGQIVSQNAPLKVLAAPSITRQPVDVDAETSDEVRFEIQATGTPPLLYQWQKDGDNLPGATGAFLVINNVELTDAGQYRVQVSNEVESIFSITGRLTVQTVDKPPSVEQHPQGGTFEEGATVTFRVIAIGSPPPTFQWQFNQQDIANATGDTLVIGNVPAAAAGSYRVVVSNASGTVVSEAAVLEVTAAPVFPQIVRQPVSVSVQAGGLATFKVEVVGTPPLEYQWQFNQLDIANANSDTLTLSDIPEAAAGSYRVKVSNELGFVISEPAILRVQSAVITPDIVQHPEDSTAAAGDSVTFKVVAVGTHPFTYQWQFNQQNIAGATGDTLFVSNVSQASAGSYRAVVSNSAGTAISEPATLTVIPATGTGLPRIVQQPHSLTVEEGQEAVFEVIVEGSPPLIYQWQKNQQDLPGATSPRLVIKQTTSADAGSYRIRVSNTAGTAISNPAQLTVTAVPSAQPPQIVEQPTSVSAEPGTSVRFEVVASGSPPLILQWRKDGVNLPGASTAVLEIETVSEADAGNYQVVVSNTGGTVTSQTAILTLELPPPPGSVPVITAQPQSLHVVLGATVTFTVEAQGKEPLNYQWQSGDFSIPGARLASFTITNAQLIDQADYRVIVTDSEGASVTSEIAQLTIAEHPIIRRQPQPVVVVEGGTAVFSVVAEGIPPLAYQWQYNGANIPGGAARNNEFRIEEVQQADQGEYRVIVTDSQGTVVSEIAALTVTDRTEALAIDSVELAGNVLTIQWNGGPGIVLQIKANLNDPNWQDVPGTMGQNSVEQLALGFSAWYRLIQR